MTRAEALIDAAMTLHLWQREFPADRQYFAVFYIARQLGCYASWQAIQSAIVLRNMAETEAQDVQMRRAA